MNRFVFNLTHWCFDYDEYLDEYKFLDSGSFVNRLEKFNEYVRKNYPGIVERGYTDRETLKGFFFSFPKSKKVQEVRTSGSSGKPFHFWVDSRAMASRFALVDYRFRQIGYKKGDSFVRFWYPTTGHTKIQLLKEKLWRIVNREHFISYFDMVSGKKKMIDYVRFIQKHKPKLIEGYAGGLIAMAEFILEHGIKMPKVEWIVTGAGMVNQKHKKMIEEAFNCSVYDRYGCSEFGEIAHQLPGIDYYESNPYLEIFVATDKKMYKLHEAPDGEYGIFVTDPRNYATPFWRYRMGDIVKVENGKIIAIKGRAEETMRLPNGDYLPTGFFYQFFKDSAWVDRWQIIYDPAEKELIVKTSPYYLEENLRNVLERQYFRGIKVKYQIGNFETTGRRKKIQEIIIR